MCIRDSAGTHRAYPVLEATIKSDNGLVGFVKENKSLLQFGNPDETDQESYKQVELVTNCSSYATWSGDEKWKTDTGGNFLYRDSKTAGTMAVNDLGLNNGTKGLFLTASGNTAGENTKWWNGAMKAIAIVDSNGEKGCLLYTSSEAERNRITDDVGCEKNLLFSGAYGTICLDD